MPNVSFDAAGLERIYWGRNIEGYCYGTAKTLANGADSGMARLRGAKTVSMQPTQPDRLTQTYDNGTGNVFIFPSRELPNGTMGLGIFHSDFTAAAQDTLVHSDGDLDVSVLQPDDPEFGDLTLIVVSPNKSTTPGTLGSKGYQNIIYPKVNVVPLGPENLQEGPNGIVYTHALVASKSDRWPWGKLLSLADEGTTSAPMSAPMDSVGPVLCHSLRGDGTVATLVLDFTPLGLAYMGIWVDGVKLTPTTDFTLSGSTITFLDVPGAGELAVVRYQTAN